MRTFILTVGVCSLLGLSACDLFRDEGIAAEDDTAQTSPGQPVSIDVLANDSGDGIYVFDFNPTTSNGGTIELEDDGRLRYTPHEGFRGTEGFNYRISDERPSETESPRTDAAFVTVVVE